MTNEQVKATILAKVRELAKSLGRDPRSLKTSDTIPSSGALDSAGLMELMIWFEAEFELSIPQEDFTLENFGSVDQMASYVEAHRAAE